MATKSAAKDDASTIMRGIGLDPRRTNNRLVVQAALDRGIIVRKGNSPTSVMLEFGGERHRYSNGGSSLNHPLINTIVRQKDVLASLLRSSGLPALENSRFDIAEVNRAWGWASKFESVVVKPADGKQGKDVYVNITNYSDFVEAFEYVSSSRESVLVEEFHRGIEHRFLLVDGRVKAVAYMRRPSVVGNGTSTVEELVAERNAKRAKGHGKIQLGSEALRHLDGQGFTTKSIIPQDERVLLGGRSNTQTGADAIDVTDSIDRAIKEDIASISRPLRGGRLLGVDAFISDTEHENSLRIIEINSYPQITFHHRPQEGKSRKVAADILEAMFG